MKPKTILSIFLFAMFTSQTLLSQEKVDSAAMKRSKSIHEVEWEEYKKLQSERNPQFEYSLLETDSNPFNLQKTIEYDLSVASEVSLEVYTIDQ